MFENEPRGHHELNSWEFKLQAFDNRNKRENHLISKKVLNVRLGTRSRWARFRYRTVIVNIYYCVELGPNIGQRRGLSTFTATRHK